MAVEEKVMVSRSTTNYVLENAALFGWLISSYVSSKVSLTLIQLLLFANGLSTNLAEFLGDVSKEAIQTNTDTQKHLTLLGQRIFTVEAVVTPSAIEEAYKAPLRDHFLMVSALLDGYGNSSFIHKPAGFFEHDKNTFKSALFHGEEKVCAKIRQNLPALLEHNEDWQTTSVFDMIRRMMFVIIGDSLLGIHQEEMLKEYQPLTEALDTFETMWQHPDKFNPLVMFMVYQKLESISNTFHQFREPAEMPDGFARLYDRPMNMTAVLMVASNLIHFITAAILHQCTQAHGPQFKDGELEDLAKEIATWRFRDSRIYRLNSGIFKSNAPNHQIGDHECLPRSLTIIPQGDMNHHRMKTESIHKENGRVKDPVLFGRGRPCPGAAISMAAVRSVLDAVAKKGVTFVPNTSQYKAYTFFVENRDNWDKGRDCGDEPGVTGQWVTQSA